MILPLMWLGKTDRIEEVAQAAASSTRANYDWGDQSLSQGALTCWAVACGEFERAETHAIEVLRLLRRSGYPWAAPTALPALALGRLLRGAWAESDEALSLLASPGEVFTDPGPDTVSMSFLLRQVLLAWRSPEDRRAVRGTLELLLPQLVEAARGDIYALGLLSATVGCAELLAAPILVETAY